MESAERYCGHPFVAYLHIISWHRDGEAAGRAVGTTRTRGHRLLNICSACTFEQTANYANRMLRLMQLQSIKMIVSALWVLTALVIAITVDLSWRGDIALAVLGLVPPLVILVWWKDPAQTMSESIRDAQR